MGNHVAPGIPALLAKNWQPVPDRPNSFRNKVTFQYTHKHIINIEDPMQIQSFKLRMKQTNAYICRVLFYHQYHDSIYHVYTDQIHLQPNITKSDIWRAQKIKIVQSFSHLAQVYGYMKVCRQMIGADSNGHPKIWIHPDPVCSKPWSYSNSQTSMLTDILTMLQNIQEKSGILKPKKQANRSTTSTIHQQYTTFAEYVRSQIQTLNAQYAINAHNAQPKTKANRNSAFVENAASSTNIEMERKKKNMNKTYAQHISENKNSDFHHYGRQPRFSNTMDYKEQINNTTKPNILQKLFNPTVCETSRDEESYVRIPAHSPYTVAKRNNQRKNLSLQRPATYNNNVSMIQNEKKNVDESYKTLNEKPTLNKRRDTQNFKILLQNTLNQNVFKEREDKTKSMTAGPYTKLPTKKSTMNIDTQNNQKSLKKSPLGKLITQTSQTFKPNVTVAPTYSPVNYQRQKNRQNKTLQGFYHAKNFDFTTNNKSSMNKTHQVHQFHKKQMKNASIPNFLMKSNTELVKQMWESAPTDDKHPSTQRQKREDVVKQFKVLEISQSNFLLDKSNDAESEQAHPGMRQRKNTAAILKQQLHNILESPIQPQPRPVSVDYQNFKSVKMFYRQPHFEEDIQYQSSEKDQFDVIKEKVEQKKARFAQLKMDARKILQDSI